MSPLRIIALLTVALIFLSYSIPIACIDKDAKEDATTDAVNAVAEAPGDSDPTVDADSAPAPTTVVKHSMVFLKASVRVGANVTRALTHAAVHAMVATVRTAYHAVEAIT